MKYYRQWFFRGAVSIVALNFCGRQIECLKGRSRIRAKVSMFAGWVCCTSMHCCCKQNTLSLSFQTKQQSSFVLVLQEKWDEPYKKNSPWKVPLWFLGGRLICSSKKITTFLTIWKLPSIKVRMSALRTFTKNLFSCSWVKACWRTWLTHKDR